MEEKLKAMQKKLGQLENKINNLSRIQNSNVGSQDYQKLQIQLEQKKIERLNYERKLRDEAWEREDQLRALDFRNEFFQRDFAIQDLEEKQKHEMAMLEMKRKNEKMPKSAFIIPLSLSILAVSFFIMRSHK